MMHVKVEEEEVVVEVVENLILLKGKCRKIHSFGLMREMRKVRLAKPYNQFLH